MFVTVRTFVSAHEVWVNDEKVSLKESRLLQNHSEAFSWGYLGSGPAQTALGVCNHLFGPYIAQEVYHQLKCDHVQNWHRWDDGERSVNIEKFYLDYIEGRVMEHALSRFCNNVYDRLFVAVEHDAEAVCLVNESSVVCSDAQVRIILEKDSATIERICEALNLSYLNFDGRWNVVGAMPTTPYLRKLLATAKICLQV